MTKRTSHNVSTSPASSSMLFSRFAALALLIGMVIAFFASQLVGVYVASKLLLPAAQTASIDELFDLGSIDGTVVSVSIIISCLLLMILIAAIIRLKGGSIRHYLALKPFNVAFGIATFGILLLFMIASQALSYWLDKAPSDFIDPLYQSVSSVWLLVFAIVIVAPLYEELIFRGLLWRAISEQFAGQVLEQSSTSPKKHLIKVWGAIIASVVTSLIFAMIHLQYGIYEISTIIVLALIFCYARYKSGSLWLPILLHIINNGAAMWLYLSSIN